MLPLILGGVALLLAASAGGGASKGPTGPGSGTVRKGPPPRATIALKLGATPDPLLDAATKAVAYVNTDPSKASELVSLAALARSKNRADVAAVLSAGAPAPAPPAPAARPVLHLAGLGVP